MDSVETEVVGPEVGSEVGPGPEIGSEVGSEAVVASSTVAGSENLDTGADWPADRRKRILRLAAAWGTSPNYLYKLEKRGCPLDSLEAATAWRQANTKLGVGYRSHRSTSFSRSKEGGGVARPKRNKLKSLEASLKEAVAMEEEAAAMVRACLGDPDKAGQAITAMNAFNKAQANRMDREKSVVELLEAQKKLVPIDYAIDILKKGWQPLLQRLRTVARRAAPRANPVDDVLAESAITEEIEDCIAEAERTYVVLLESFA